MQPRLQNYCSVLQEPASCLEAMRGVSRHFRSRMATMANESSPPQRPLLAQRLRTLPPSRPNSLQSGVRPSGIMKRQPATSRGQAKTTGVTRPLPRSLQQNRDTSPGPASKVHPPSLTSASPKALPSRPLPGLGSRAEELRDCQDLASKNAAALGASANGQ